MIVTTTDGVEGRAIVEYRGIVSGEAVMGTNVFRTSSQASPIWSAADRAPTSRSCARPRTSRSHRWSKTPASSARMPWSASTSTTSTWAVGAARC